MAYFFRLFYTTLRYPSLFLLCVSRLVRPVSIVQVLLSVSFCQHLVPDFASLMFCQHVTGQSLSPASFLNLSIKSCRTIIYLSCTVLLTNKIHFEYSQGLEKFLFIYHSHIHSQNKNNFQKGQHHSCYIFYPSTAWALLYL